MKQLGLGAFTATQRAPEWVEDKRMVRPEQLDSLERWVRSTPELVVDYETNGLKTWKGFKPFMVGFFAPDKGAKVVDLRLLGDAGLRAVRDGLSKREGVTIAHNFKMELSHSRALGFELGGKLWCNYAAYFALDEREESLAQDELVRKYLKRDTPQWRALAHWMNTNLGGVREGHELNPNTLEVPYSCEDVTDCWDLYVAARKRCPASQEELIWTDGALTRPVSEMEENGLHLDLERCAALTAEWGEQRAQCYRNVCRIVGGNPDLASHQTLFGLLYGRYRLPMHADIEKQGKLDHDVLMWMLTLPEVVGNADLHTLITSVLQWRELSKLLDTYLLPWQYEHGSDGILHPNLNLCVAETRRFTADNPNLQNIPTRTDLGKLLRACVIASIDEEVWCLDYSQIEYRGFAHYSGEPRLVQGYHKDPSFDIHALVGSLCGVSRSDGKHLNFGMLYGMGVEKLRRKLRCGLDRARSILDTYHKQIPTVKRLKQKLEAEIKAKGYISDCFGGRRHLAGNDAYKALNSLCQMTAANLMRRAMVACYPALKAAGAKQRLQIHDEMKFGLPRGEFTNLQVVDECQQLMTRASPMSVPCLVDAEFYREDWAHLSKMEEWK